MFSYWSLFFILKKNGEYKKENKDLNHTGRHLYGPGFAGALTVKSRKTRFLEPLRRAMSAALGWLAMAFWALGAEPVPPTAGCLNYQTDSVGAQTDNCAHPSLHAAVPGLCFPAHPCSFTQGLNYGVQAAVTCPLLPATLQDTLHGTGRQRWAPHC